MAIELKQQLRISQQLVMTPQLQQAIKLLQMNNLDLSDFLSQEVEKNPLLEMEDSGGEAQGEREGEREGERDGERGSEQESAEISSRADDGGDDAPDAEFEPASGMVEADRGLSESNAGDEPLDADFSENVFNNDGPSEAPVGGDTGMSASPGPSAGGMEAPSAAIEQTLRETISLRDHLIEQMLLVVPDSADRFIAAHLVESIDEAGYMMESPGRVAERLGCKEQDVARVLGELKGLDPVGVFARDLAECLELQLKERNRFDPAMEMLLKHLDLVARQELPALRRLCRVSRADLADMISELKQLNPKPGLAFGGEPVQPVVPDVFVKKTPTGAWAVELNSDTLPRVLVNKKYYAELNTMAGKSEDKAYLADCLSDANWLVKALDQRARTILKVSMEIVRQQDAFLTEGIKALKPATLRSIAEAIEMHESTVSRVTSNKYIATNRGIFELKYFFTSAIPASTEGDSHSATAVRRRIQQLIDDESPSKILSDDKIVNILRGEDIEIARRTVAKYREALRIPSSVERRRIKRLAMS